MSNSLNDGLSKPDQLELLSVDPAEIASQAVSGNKLASGGVPLVACAPAIGEVLTGSPAVGNTVIQFGAASTGAGSDAWVVFGSAFAAAPAFVALSNGAVEAACGSPVVAGSAYVRMATASKPFSWLAAGSGRV